MEKLISWFNTAWENFQQWVLDLVLWIPRKIYAAIADDTASFIESLNPPPGTDEFILYIAQWGDQAGYWFELLQVNWGFSLITSVLLFRWAKKFVPFFG